MNIQTARFLISNSKPESCPETRLPEFAFIGRSNVGKSSLINMLTRHKGLAMTSSTPGKTMLINHFIINEDIKNGWYIVDLPGYGYAKRGKKAMAELERIISEYILKREALTNLFVLVDSRLEPQRIDLEFIEWLGENGVPFSIVFTKADKNKAGELKKNVTRFLNKLAEQWEELPPHFVTSSERNIGREELLSYISDIINSIDANTISE